MAALGYWDLGYLDRVEFSRVRPELQKGLLGSGGLYRKSIWLFFFFKENCRNITVSIKSMANKLYKLHTTYDCFSISNGKVKAWNVKVINLENDFWSIRRTFFVHCRGGSFWFNISYKMTSSFLKVNRYNKTVSTNTSTQPHSVHLEYWAVVFSSLIQRK